MRNLWIALESGWRHGLHQYRHMRLRQRRATSDQRLVTTSGEVE